ncbi:unnamed protein product [Caenorhabditis nigoni]
MFGKKYEAAIGIQPEHLCDLEVHDRTKTIRRTSFKDQLQKWIGTNNKINVVKRFHLSGNEKSARIQIARIRKCVTSKKWKKNEAIYHLTKRVSGMADCYEEQKQYIHESDIKRLAFE